MRAACCVPKFSWLHQQTSLVELNVAYESFRYAAEVDHDDDKQRQCPLGQVVPGVRAHRADGGPEVKSPAPAWGVDVAWGGGWGDCKQAGGRLEA